MSARPSIPNPGSPAPTVGLAQEKSRRTTVAAALEAIAHEIDLRDVKQVLVKPNFVSPDRQLAATHVDAVRAVLDFLRPRFSGPIVIAEGAALTATRDSFHSYGYESLVDEYGVELRDLNTDDTVGVTVYNRRLQPMQLRLARTVPEADFRVSVCPPKTHDNVLVTLSIKNIVMGSLVNPHASTGNRTAGPLQRTARRLGRLIPNWWHYLTLAEWVKGNLLGGPRGSQKMSMHQGIPTLNLNLALVAPTVWPHLAVIDGWEGMEGDGPGNGDPVPWRIALAGTDPLAVDALTARLMGFDPEEIGYLRYCQMLGLGTATQTGIRVVGGVSLSTVKHSFRPHSTLKAQRRWHLRNAEQYLTKRQDVLK